MRELKFRVWSDFWEKYADFEAELYMDGSIDADFEDDNGIPHHETTDLVIEQYTGLKDKNGKEIYEGDIVDDGYHICKIRWSEHFAAFEAVNENDNYVSNIWFESKYGKVIGSIHENPELLEQEQE